MIFEDFVFVFHFCQCGLGGVKHPWGILTMAIKFYTLKNRIYFRRVILLIEDSCGLFVLSLFRKA